MLDPEKSRERDLLVKRLRELDQEYAENQCELWKLKTRQASRLPLEKQFAFYLNEYLRNVKRDRDGARRESSRIREKICLR